MHLTPSYRKYSSNSYSYRNRNAWLPRARRGATGQLLSMDGLYNVDRAGPDHTPVGSSLTRGCALKRAICRSLPVFWTDPDAVALTKSVNLCRLLLIFKSLLPSAPSLTAPRQSGSLAIRCEIARNKSALYNTHTCYPHPRSAYRCRFPVTNPEVFLNDGSFCHFFVHLLPPIRVEYELLLLRRLEGFTHQF